MASDTESNDVAGIDKPRDPRSGVPGVLLGDMIQKNRVSGPRATISGSETDTTKMDATRS